MLVGCLEPVSYTHLDVYKRQLLGRADYYEVHNALADAVDELLIMRLLAHPLCLYQKPAKAPRAAR